MLASGCWLTETPELPQLVRIIAPAAGTSVAGAQTIVTISSSLQEDVWVFVYPSTAGGRGYPQAVDCDRGTPTVRDGGGNWIVTVGLGGNPPLQYDIVAFTATVQASNALKQQYVEWCARGDHPGLLAVPQGFREWDRVTIRRDR